MAPFSLIDYTANVEHRAGRGMFSEATVKVTVGDEVFHEVAEGNGPVNAMNLALRKAIQNIYPRLRDVHLTDYKVRILDSQSGTAAMVRVLIDCTDGERSWTTSRQHQHHRKSWIALRFGGLLLTERGAAQQPEAHDGGSQTAAGQAQST